MNRQRCERAGDTPGDKSGRGTCIRTAPDAMNVIAADFGGTRIKAGLVNGGSCGGVEILPAPEHRRLEPILPDLAAMFAGMIAKAPGTVESLAWALPCVVASDQRTITRTFGKYDDAPDIDLEQWARDTLGLPLRIDNDARAAAVGEWLEGAGRGFDHLVMVTLGTGIGTAVISHGKPLWGQGGFAGNLGGHGSPRDGGRPCICGQNGCAEAHAASWALPGIASESPVFLQSSLSRAERIDYLAVFEQAALGDQLARELKENAYREWTLLLTRLTMQFDPECIVIGGGIMASGEILPTLQDRLARAVTTRHIVLRQSELGDAAALVGGAGFRTICNTSH